MNKSIKLFAISCVALLSLCGCTKKTEPIPEPTPTPEPEIKVTKKDTVCYFATPSNKNMQTLYFLNGKNDIPYLEIKDVCDLLNAYATIGLGFMDYKVTYTNNHGVFTLSREDGTTLSIDCLKSTIYSDDYSKFLKYPYQQNGFDRIAMSGFESDGVTPRYITRKDLKTDVFKYGTTTLDFAKYNIPFYYVSEKGYIPVTIFNNYIAQVLSLVYNNQDSFIVTNADPGALSDLYYATPKTKFSTEFAEYNYNTFIASLDYLYGLKDEHHVINFDTLFSSNGYKERLMSTDPQVYDTALAEITFGVLGDYHSGFRAHNPYVTKDSPNVDGKALPANYDAYNQGKLYSDAREKYYPNGFVPYEEIGDTAIITFDEFKSSTTKDFYTTTATLDDYLNTLALIQYSNTQIRRENSPIKNVVLDLSNNGGGEIDAAIYLASWFLKKSIFNISNTLTKAQGDATYMADVNLDRKFDEKDNITDLKRFCLTSKNSFSCGNLIPSMFKASDQVTLLGKTSGGGTCIVGQMVTSGGTFIQVSSPYEMCVVKNGSFYNIDRGIAPDYDISNPETFYDRQELVDNYIHKIF